MAAAYLVLHNRRRRRQQIPARQYLIRPNHMETMSDDQLLKKYRMDHGGIEYLCRELHDDLVRPTRRSNAISVEVQVLAALRYFATGSFQAVTGDTLNVSRFSVSRSLYHKVADLPVKKLLHRHIRFPRGNVIQRITKESFYAIANFPNVLGVIGGDCPSGR